MKELIEEMISYYEMKVADLDRIYFFSQDTDKSLISYKKRKKADIVAKEIYEDILADLGRLLAMKD